MIIFLASMISAPIFQCLIKLRILPETIWNGMTLNVWRMELRSREEKKAKNKTGQYSRKEGEIEKRRILSDRKKKEQSKGQESRCSRKISSRNSEKTCRWKRSTPDWIRKQQRML